ncbi:hypothetical protein [Klebsiella michiganensis]|uniref:hypothetical protein n=1 Tax=Klebsiella michiganensis TaxID=1134687 RepID=UPI000D64D21D|nr:hypothetical protein [Klebsiella michiganensis]MBZ7392398.1 hypothetical protein [Klebsiella michiganensis]MDL4446318.1 hypothetical protein [Klebsiella michiganensis]MDL4490886.1 hypothetical protein [Klebsiella michiganensis]MDL4659629.1 hypothetical protein [Klebsiella michiganensis]
MKAINAVASSRIEQARDYFNSFKGAATQQQLNRISHRYHLPLKGCGTTIDKKWAGALVGLAHAAEFELVARADWSVLEAM